MTAKTYEWLGTEITKWCEGHYYGYIQINISGGEVKNINLHRTKLPPKDTAVSNIKQEDKSDGR